MNKAGYGITFYHQEAVQAMQEKCTHAHLDIAEYLLRDMVNMAFGNRDNHGRNTAFHRYNNHTGISPLFDFAPMYGVSTLFRTRNLIFYAALACSILCCS